MQQITSFSDPAIIGHPIAKSPQDDGEESNADLYGAYLLSLYIRLTPLLWAFGLLTPLGAILLLYLSFRKARWASFGAVAWSWWVIGVMQAASVFVNWANTDLPFSSLLYRLGGAPVIGWFFIGAAIGAGKVYGLTSPRVVRSVCVLGLYLLTFGVISVLIAIASGMDNLTVPSPLAFLFPDDLPLVINSLNMRFFLLDETLGNTVPRLVLFYPWSTILGFAGIAIFMIAWQDTDRRWQLVGMLGGVFGMIGSLSRAAIVAFLAVVAVYGWQRIPRAYQFGAMAITSIAGTVLVVTDVSVSDVLSRMNASITGMREGSSDARQIGYDESWQGFLHSPVFGHGWPGEMISDTIPMAIGSHSSFYGLLYTGGLLTFLSFCLASVITLIAIYQKALPQAPASRAGLSIMVALIIMSYGEGISSFAIPVLFAFCWLGGGLNNRSAPQ